MTAHQDVAGVVESLPERLRTNTCRYGYESETEAAKRRIATDLEAATLIESLSKALSEAEAQADKYCEWWREKRNECMAAESRLAEAMSHLQAMHRYASRNEAGPEIDAACAFLNAGKE